MCRKSIFLWHRYRVILNFSSIHYTFNVYGMWIKCHRNLVKEYVIRWYIFKCNIIWPASCEKGPSDMCKTCRPRQARSGSRLFDTCHINSTYSRTCLSSHLLRAATCVEQPLGIIPNKHFPITLPCFKQPPAFSSQLFGFPWVAA